MSTDVGFSWGNCGSSSEAIQLKTLKISPDPIKIPGNVTVNLIVAITSTLPTDLQASLILEKKIGKFFIKVPCEHDIGSCTYNNICEKWAEICRKYFEKYGFPCQCPIPAGTYSIPDGTIDATKKIPAQADGEFKLTVHINGHAGRVGCVDLHFKLKS